MPHKLFTCCQDSNGAFVSSVIPPASQCMTWDSLGVERIGGQREGRREGGEEGGREGKREGGEEGGREGKREGGREGKREGGGERRGRRKKTLLKSVYCMRLKEACSLWFGMNIQKRWQLSVQSLPSSILYQWANLRGWSVKTCWYAYTYKSRDLNLGTVSIYCSVYDLGQSDRILSIGSNCWWC